MTWKVCTNNIWSLSGARRELNLKIHEQNETGEKGNFFYRNSVSIVSRLLAAFPTSLPECSTCARLERNLNIFKINKGTWWEQRNSRGTEGNSLLFVFNYHCEVSQGINTLWVRRRKTSRCLNPVPPFALPDFNRVFFNSAFVSTLLIVVWKMR